MELQIVAEKRNTKRKSDLKNLRKDGMIPAVIYGPKQDSFNVSINERDFIKQYRSAFGKIAFYTIDFDSKKYHTLIREEQMDPVSRDIIHLDFLIINEKEEMNFNIPMKFTGRAKGVESGGALNVIRNTVEIKCLPKDVPDFFEFSVEELGLEETLHLADLDFKDFHVVDDKDLSAVSVLSPEIEEEETEDDELMEETAETPAE